MQAFKRRKVILPQKTGDQVKPPKLIHTILVVKEYYPKQKILYGVNL